MGFEINVKARGTEIGEIGNGRFGAGQQHNFGIAGQSLARFDHDYPHVRLGQQRVEIIKIGDAGQNWHGNRQPAVAGRARNGQRHGIFGRQFLSIAEKRHKAKGAPAGAPGNHLHPRFKQSGITAKFIDDKSADHGSIGGVEHHFGANDLGNHPAPVNIAHQYHRHIGGPRKAHIGNVIGAKVNLGGAARPFHNHKICLRPQMRKTVLHRLHQPGLPALIFARARVAENPALHHDLRAGFRLRFQQYRVHVDGRVHPASPGLQSLRAANFAAVRRHRCIIGHVLRLERAHIVAAQRQRPAQPGHQHGFADIRAGALQHDGFGALQNSMPCCAFTPAAKWCLTSVISVTRSAAAIISGLALRPVTMICRPSRRACRAATTS